ncbi:MAG: NEL-type E3 ubiquitin ligase domain-containing protein [Pseudomonas proteolytica]|uniref:NEL-type E3 ubiquitin ligase domain-containing protein n=1 Tax=Pseudomonas proteolytica TaxID=219574 RepID=UPI003F2AC3AA
MSELPLPAQPLATLPKGPHYELIKQHIPTWLSTATLARIGQLNTAELSRPTWYASASPPQHEALQRTNAEGWRTQNEVDRQLDEVRDVYAFAEPLLKKAIADRYGLHLDVKATFLNLYIAKTLPWYALTISAGVTSRKVSLLDAALHNFAQSETFEEDSCYISQPDYRGHFTTQPLHDTMTIAQFKALCRELDLGARYQQHLNSHLLPASPTTRATLQHNIIASQKAALKAAAQLAVLKTNGQQAPDLSAAAHAVLMRALRGERGVMQFYQLRILDAQLTGILLIAADLDRVSSVSKVIAYIPHDPESPVKEYDSSLAFMRDLTRKLQANAPIPSRGQQTYQQFFSQFVDHSLRGHFFAGLDQRLCQVQWHEKTPLDPRPQWRETPLDNPRLQFSAVRIDGDLWEYLYQQALNKILNDGRTLVVSTADADSAQRWAWWDNLTKVVADLFNIALMVVTPFVPFLGELMLAYTAYQLSSDVIEGLVDLTEGQFREGAEHLVSVATDVVQLATVGVGTALGGAFKRSAFVDGLHRVDVNGQQRLWHPDLAPYARSDLRLRQDAQPDALGLHLLDEQRILRLDERHYEVTHDPASDTYRIKHPTRSQAYAPRLEHNDHGAWLHEGEDPRTWDSQTLRSRLGPLAQGLSPAEREQACATSGTHDGALRMMYAHREPPPPLLVDSLKRLQLRRHVRRAPQLMRTGAPADLPTNWSVQTTCELPGWPADKAIDVFINHDLSGYAMRYGASEATPANTLQIRHEDVRAGKLPEQVVEFLSTTQLKALLPTPLPATAPRQIEALREQLAKRLVTQQTTIFNHLYSAREVLDTPHGQLIQQQFPHLPADLVSTLLLRTSLEELEVMSQTQRIPLRLKNLARELANEVRASHAAEGLHEDALLTPDTERMALNIVRLNTDALGDLNIAVHEQSPEGALRCQVGPVDAGTQKILLYKGPGRYQIHDAQHLAPTAHYSFYEALLRVLPADALDYRPGQGEILRAWLREQLEPLAARRTVLEAPTRRQADDRTLQRLLQKPGFEAFRRLFRRQPAPPPTLQETLGKLCPLLNEQEIEQVTPFLNTPPGKQLLGKLEADHQLLLEDLRRIRKSRTLGMPGSVLEENELLMRKLIVRELRTCWEEGAYLRMLPPQPSPRGTLLDLSELVLGRYVHHMEPLRADFSHVTRLNLSGTRLQDQEMGFLDNFPSVRIVDLSDNELTGIPPQLTDLKNLTALNLSLNPIRWVNYDYEVLKRLPQLHSLNLEGHTQLKVPPDISLMPELRRLVLRRSGITRWPAGMEAPRLAITELDMTNTAISSVPPFAEDSVGARIVASSWLDRSKLEPEDESRFVSYRRAFGFDPYRTVPRSGSADRQYWLSGLSGEERDVANKVWDDVEKEHGSQGLFDLLKLLRPPEGFQTQADAQLFSAGREDLSIRVWQLLFAADENPQFRERVFSLAATPANCADAGAHIFNRLGVETLLEQILKDNSPQALRQRENRLVSLARQAWRLEQVNRLAREEVRHRLAPTSEGGLGQTLGADEGQVDDVQVYLAYQSGLKTRLNLPWVSEHMVYRNTAKVTQAHLDKAVRTIRQMQHGDGLVNGLLEQPFWSDYLHDAYLQDFNAQGERRDKAGGQLQDLLELQQQWATGQLPAEAKARLREQLVALADELVIPHSVVLADQALPDSTVLGLYEHIQHDYNELARRLTRQALIRLG